MAARRPLVRVAGRNRHLPPGDSLLGVPAYLPAYQQGGVMLKLALNLNYAIAAYTAAGAGLTMQVVLNG